MDQIDKNIDHTEILYKYSHFISASIFVYCLQKYNPTLLFLILMLQIGYIFSTSEKKINIYGLFVCGLILFILSKYLVNNSNTELNFEIMWQIPYYTLLIYYFLYEIQLN